MVDNRFLYFKTFIPVLDNLLKSIRNLENLMIFLDLLLIILIEKMTYLMGMLMRIYWRCFDKLNKEEDLSTR
ncbi:hypothetical protein H5410_005279 [Solanum commersonii]|uniref:Uncharacterized protein n=1 Tax=Solanum commersonii TaxID=4109 RepID=A0A9J6A674_SOLCO|nr:hypothetical protein H5410_005279 [Solanum commersonii]